MSHVQITHFACYLTNQVDEGGASLEHSYFFGGSESATGLNPVIGPPADLFSLDRLTNQEYRRDAPVHSLSRRRGDRVTISSPEYTFGLEEIRLFLFSCNVGPLSQKISRPVFSLASMRKGETFLGEFGLPASPSAS